MAKQRRSLSGKVVAITGGARGIGKATASALVAKGCRVAIGDVDLTLAEQTAAGLGGGTVALPLDVTDRASFNAFLDEAERQLGPLDVVVNNAGIMPVTPFVEESEASFKRQIDINLVGVITGTQLALERMLPRNRGHVVNIASQAGKAGFPGIATYSATKHAVVGLSEAVRAELRGREVEISCVMPTVVNTELTSGVGQRWVKPVEVEDVANAIVLALEMPRFDVFVPKANEALLRIGAVLPRSVREWVARVMGTDKLMTEVDHGARRAYEERVTKSEPSAADTATGEPGGAASADESAAAPPPAERDAA
jgi:NAD(P)-dependent dehydrogenase (short-subunit alcohol dehydrogenase family)